MDGGGHQLTEGRLLQIKSTTATAQMQIMLIVACRERNQTTEEPVARLSGHDVAAFVQQRLATNGTIGSEYLENTFLIMSTYR